MNQIVIVGVGALGSHAALLLRNLDVRLKVIDFDRVAQKNVLSQFHTRMGVGRNKAQALAQSLHGLFGVKVEAVPHKLREDNAEALLGGADLILDCLDNAVSRALVQRLARAQDLACVHGALAAGGQFGRVVWDAHFRIDAEDEAGQATCEDGQHLPFITLVSACLARSAQDFIEKGERRSFHILPTGAVEPL